jgi:molecular chaperone DnaJ
MGEKDPCEVLGVNRDASEDEIKEAYREKVKRYHPDACEKENAEELFKRVKDAYETIQSDGSTDTGSGQGKASADTGSGSTEKRSGKGRERKGQSEAEGKDRAN